jgi:hypothetical protein
MIGNANPDAIYVLTDKIAALPDSSHPESAMPLGLFAGSCTKSI